ncbi:MAG: aspartate ammonia-lyase [Gammaproteobacteria bacterium]|nr:aspartate ammonia-lyase [Gammaproteobacteria bacterium]
MKYRTEHDSLGERKIPSDKYYGTQTLRAIENFKITGNTMGSRPKFVHALAAIKQAAALTNMELGLLDSKKGNAIIEASKEVYEGKFNDEFPIDMIQGGAGTSANMNANEVICNRALEIMGHQKGEYEYLHPNNHVNLSQSTNDVYPTASKIAIVLSSVELIEGIEAIRDAFFTKSKEFKEIIKMGRTQLQDAVPMTMGQEFRAFGVSIDEDLVRLKEVLDLCNVINMGATAIGTGINTLPGYAEIVCSHLAEITGLPLTEAPDLVEATSDTGVFVSVSSILKRIAVKLTKICNDLRLLSSGPIAGFNDINLPAVQPGSSIMPGKVNPVIPEVVNQVCFQIIGYDTTITLAASAGQLQLNAFEPVIVYDLLESMTLFRRACLTLKENCVDGITANEEHCREEVLRSPGLITAFAPYIGYEESARIAKDVLKSGKTVYDYIKESGILDDKDIEIILSPKNMTSPHAKFDIIVKVREKQEEGE